MATMRVAFGICALMALTVLPVDGGEPLKLAVSPVKSFAPASMRIRANIEPNPENRALAIIADGTTFYRSSEIPLEGDRAPKIIELRFSDLPGGEYQVYAVLMDAVGHQRAIAHHS